VNDSGEIFISHTVLQGRFALRVAIGNLQTTDRHVRRAWEIVQEALANERVFLLSFRRRGMSRTRERSRGRVERKRDTPHGAYSITGTRRARVAPRCRGAREHPPPALPRPKPAELGPHRLPAPLTRCRLVARRRRWRRDGWPESAASSSQ
jgi:hypothetical protein